MYVIVKTVYSLTYYYNSENERWEGLIDNATKFSTKRGCSMKVIRLRKIGIEVSHISKK